MPAHPSWRCLPLLGALAPGRGQAPHAAVGPVGLADARWTTGLLGRPVRDVPDGHRARHGHAHGGHGAEPVPAQLPDRGRAGRGQAPRPAVERRRLLQVARSGRRGLRRHEGRGPRPADGRGRSRVIAKAQRADGYLHTPVLIANRNGDAAARPFQDRLDFEMYNFGHLITAACVHHRATGKTDAPRRRGQGRRLPVPGVRARRRPSWPATPSARRTTWGSVDLYRTTGDTRYLRSGGKLLDMRDLVDRRHGRQPGPHPVPQADGGRRPRRPGELPLRRGRRRLRRDRRRDAARPRCARSGTNVVTRKMYVTGACGALYDGASPDGVEGPEADRPRPPGLRPRLPVARTAPPTTRPAPRIGNVLWNWRMLQVTGEAKFADVLETGALQRRPRRRQPGRHAVLLHEHAPAARPDAGRRCGGRGSGEEWISCFCCPPNVARTIAEVDSYAYGRSDRGVWVHLYGGSTLDTDAARRSPAEADAGDGLPVGRPGEDHGRRGAGRRVLAVPPRPRLGRRGDRSAVNGKPVRRSSRPRTPRCGGPGRPATWSN